MSARSLQALQQAFSAALFDPNDRQVLVSIAGSSDQASNKRLDIYRNNVFHSLTEALADLYPVVKRLVGGQFFGGMARHYIRERPPRSAAMVHFATDFPEFLREFEPARALAYLPDVALVELSWQQSYHAKDATALQGGDFAAIGAQQLGRATIELHPSVRLLDSAYPVLAIWNTNQTDHPIDKSTDTDDSPTINLDSGGVCVCVSRPQFDVRVAEIDRASFTLLRALQRGDDLDDAMGQAADVPAGTGAPEAFANCIQQGLFSRLVGSDQRKLL